MYKRLFSFVVLLAMMVSVFSPLASFGQVNLNEKEEVSFTSEEESQIGMLNASIPDIYTLSPTFDDSRSYAPGDMVKGSFEIKNTGNISVGDLYYTVELLDGYDENTVSALYSYGEMHSSQPLSSSKMSSQQVQFIFKVPAFAKRGVTALRVSSYSATGLPLGFDDRLIVIEGTPKEKVLATKAELAVDGKSFNLGAGPNVLDGQPAQMSVTLRNVSGASIEIHPRLSVSRQFVALPSVATKKYDVVTLAAGEEKKVSFDLPTMDYEGGVYVGSFFLEAKDGEQLVSTLYPRYIISNNFGLIASVSAEGIGSVKKGDAVSFSVTYVGPSVSINIPPAEGTSDTGTLSVEITDEKGGVVASSEKRVSVTDDPHIEKIELLAEKDARVLFAKVKLSRDGQKLAEYSAQLSDSSLVDPEKKNGFKFAVIGAIILALLAGVIYFRKKSASGMAAMLFLAAIIPLSLCFASPAEANVTGVNISKPANNTVMVIGQEFQAAASATWKTCNNIYGSFKITLSFQGSSASNSNSISSSGTGGTAQGSVSVSKKFNAPMVPGTYTVRAEAVLSHQYDTNRGSDSVNIIVVCPAGTVWNGSACGVPPPPPPTSFQGSCSTNGSASTANFSRTDAPGYNTAYFRIYDMTTAGHSTCVPQGLANITPNLWDENWVSTSKSIGLTPGHKYCTWIHTKSPSGAWSSPLQQTVTCPAASPAGLNVNSSGAASVPITSSVSTLAGTTNYSKTSATAISTVLTAPATASSKNFESWSSCDSTNVTSRTCTVAVSNGATKTVTANYSACPSGQVLCSGACVTGSMCPVVVNGTCGSNNNQTGALGAWPTSGWCATGTQGSWSQTGDTSSNGGVWKWSCLGSGGGIDSPVCQYTQRCPDGQTLVNGICTSSSIQTLNVRSSGASGVDISSSASGFGGTTNYTKTSNSGISTTLTAPSSAGGRVFDGWSGCDASNAASRTCTVSLSGSEDQTVTAIYVTDPTSCPSGQAYCPATSSCISSSATCGGTSCNVSSAADIEYTLNPSIVDTPQDTCSLTWEINYTNKSAVEAGTATCIAPGVVCTLNGASVSLSGSRSINPGNYTLRCTGTDGVAQSRTFQCKVNPNYGEF